MPKDQEFVESRPEPDPTTLTTALTHREIEALRQLVEANLKGLTDLMEQRFKGFNTQLADFKESVANDKTQSGTAINAALQAQEKAAEKTERQFAATLLELKQGISKQIDGVIATADAQIKGRDDSMGQVRDRLTTIESTKKGGEDQTKRTDVTNTTLILITGVIISAIVAGVAVLAYINKG